MGILYSYFVGESSTPDPVTGLTKRQVDLVQNSWKTIMKTPTENGVFVLMEYFKAYPEDLKKFPFKDIPLEDLPKEKRFKAHCNSVLYALASIVDNLNNTEVLLGLLEKIGTNHIKHQVGPKEFKNLESVFNTIFKSLFNKETSDAWNVALNVAFSVLIKQVQ